MQSTLEPKLSDDPHDVLVVAPDIVLVAPTDQELSRLARSMRHEQNPQARNEPDFSAGAAVPPVDTTFRAVPVNRPSIGARAMRGFIGFLLALCIGVAAAAWQAYGDAGKQMLAGWAPQFVLTSPPPENPALAAQPGSSAAQASAEQAAPAQPATAESAAPAAAAVAAEPSPSLQSMARDLAAAEQQIEQLKASIEQLKAGQEQMSRDVTKAADAKASEQNLRPKLSAVSAPPPRPAAVPARKPMPPFRPAQAAATQTLPPAAAPYPPRQPDYVPRQAESLPPPPAPPPLDPELRSVPRPPLPLSQ
jgi:hypothetical protein